MTRIAFLGLGAMGARMSVNLAEAGFDVVGWNRTPPAVSAIPLASTISDAVSGADIVIAMVTDDAASEEVWRVALPAMSKDALAVEASTVSPARMAAFADDTKANGIAAIGAPVAGSRPQAEAGELLFLTGGEKTDADRFAQAADAMGKAAIHAGTAVQAASLKLMINGMLAIQTAAMAEVLRFADKAGIDPDAAVDLMAPVPVMSPAATFVGKQIAARQHAPMFTVDLMEKDLGYLTASGASPVLSEVRAAFARAQQAGHGGQHITAVAETLD